MRRLFLVLGVTAAVAVGAFGVYAGFWFHQADEAQRQIASTIVDLNIRAKSIDKNVTFLRYDSITSNGFPFEMSLTLNKPALELPITSLLRSAGVPGLKRRNQTADWTEILGTDAITFSNDTASDDTVFQFPHPITDRSYLNHKLANTYVTSSNDLTCRTKALGMIFHDIAAMKQSSASLNAELLNTDSGMSCLAKGIKVSDALSKALLYGEDESSINFSNSPSDDAHRNIHFQLRHVNAQYSPAGGIAAAEMFKKLNLVMGLGKESGLHFINPSEFGKYKQDIDMSYDGPVDKAAFHSNDLRLSFDIKHFDLKSSLMNTTLTMHAATDGNNTDENDHLSVHQRTNVSGRYDNLIAQSTNSNIAAALVPHLHSLGTLKFDLDASGNITNGLKNKSEYSSLKLNNFSVNTNPYGIDIHGNFWDQGEQQYTDMILTFRNFDKMITDIGAYALRVEAAMPEVYRKKTALLTRSHIANVRQFFHTIADTPNSNSHTMVIHVQKEPDAQFTVNGKGMLEILMLMEGRSGGLNSAGTLLR